MNEAAHTISLISPSKSSSSFDTSNSDQFVLRVEWNETVSDLSRSIRHQEIFEPQPGNFGSMDCAPRILSLGRLWEELVLRVQNGGLAIQHDTDKRPESFSIWPIFDRNFNLQMGKSFNISFKFMFFHDPRRSVSIRVAPIRTGGTSWSGPTFVPASFNAQHTIQTIQSILLFWAIMHRSLIEKKKQAAVINILNLHILTFCMFLNTKYIFKRNRWNLKQPFIMIIELSGMQFDLKSYAWFHNRERAARVRFEITSMISEQNGTEVQLPLWDRTINSQICQTMAFLSFIFCNVIGYLKKALKSD